MKLLLIFTLATFLFSSCSSYIQGIHNQISQEERQQKMARYKKYRALRGGQRNTIQNPVTLGSGANTNNTRNLLPQSSSQYNSKGTRRYSADDLKDSDNSGSLWSGKSSESYLFVTNNVKKVGDFVIIEVMAKMKEDITTELKRNFPPLPSKSAKAKQGTQDKDKDKDKKDESTVNSEVDNTKKVYDKISTQVVEQINKDYLLLRGRKEVIFRKIKRYIQVQAVVSAKDIKDNDSVSSTKLLEPKINVLRY